MRLSPLLALLCVGLGSSLLAQVPKDQIPEMKTVEPQSGKIGSVLRATGVHLGKSKVESVYLTDQTLDMMVKVLEQTDEAIQFRIPPSVKPGKLQLLVKIAGKDPVLLEEPVYITVEEEKAEEKAEAKADGKTEEKAQEKDTSTEVAAASSSATH